MNRHAAVTRLVATASILGAGGCTGTGVGPGGDPAYLLMDAPARASAHRLEIGGERVTPVLPLEVEAWSEKATLLRGDQPLSPVVLEPGRLLYVRGGRVESWQVGTDVSRDALRVTATPEAAMRLAAALGASSPRGLGTDATGAHVWKLEGPDVFQRAAWMGEVSDVREVSPEWLASARPEEGTGDAPAGSVARYARGVAADTGRAIEANNLLALPGDSELAGFVGLHTLNGQRVLLDADGGWTLFEQTPCLRADGSPGRRGHSRRVGQHLLLEGLGLVLPPGGAP